MSDQKDDITIQPAAAVEPAPQGEGAAPLQSDSQSDAPEEAPPAPDEDDQSMVLKFDDDLIAELKAHLDEGLAEIEDKVDEATKKFDAAIEELHERLSSLDIDKLQALANEAKDAVAAIAESGAADLAGRLTKLEQSFKHFL